MALYAIIESNLVTQVIVADSTFMEQNYDGQTYRETRVDGSIRNRYAGIGDYYDSTNDVFYYPQPFASWTLDGNYVWQPPVSIPADSDTKIYNWDEDNRQWTYVREAS